MEIGTQQQAWQQKDPSEMTDKELGLAMRAGASSTRGDAAIAEFRIRQIAAQLEAVHAQKAAAQAEERAAEAATQSAKAAKLNGWLMLASVIVALVSAIAAAFSAYFSYLSVLEHIGK